MDQRLVVYRHRPSIATTLSRACSVHRGQGGIRRWYTQVRCSVAGISSFQVSQGYRVRRFPRWSSLAHLNLSADVGKQHMLGTETGRETGEADTHAYRE